MITHLTFNMTAVIEMAVIAVLVAAAVRLPPAVGWKAEAKRGVARAACGCVAGVATWVCVQVAGQLLEPSVAPKWAMAAPIISIPTPFPGSVGQMPKLPGHDI